jgi:hypothetical protein
MKIKTFQIDSKKDEKNVGFLSYETMMKAYGRVNSSIYKQTFDGNVDAENLETVFTILNCHQPPAYQGHSMSVSDVVAVVDDNGTKYYFCDSIGFKEIVFDESQCAPLEGNMAVIVEPGKQPYAAKVRDNLRAWQRIVDGYVESAHPFDDNVLLYCNEEAVWRELDENRPVNGQMVMGTFFILGTEDSNNEPISLTDEQVKRYIEMFQC